MTPTQPGSPAAGRPPLPHRIATVLLALVFLWAGALKALDPAAFASDIANYRLLPPLASGLLALHLPWLEIVAAGALLLGRARRAALLLLSLLSLLFCLALASAALRGLDISCGCFGSGPSDSGGSLLPALTRALALLLLCLWLQRRGAPFASRASSPN